MDFYLTITFVVIGSAIGLIIVVGRKIPRLANLSKEEMLVLAQKRGILDHLREFDFKKYWAGFILLIEKILRRARIQFLKIESLLAQWIKKLRESSQKMTQRPKEWIKRREVKKIGLNENNLSEKDDKQKTINVGWFRWPDLIKKKKNRNGLTFLDNIASEKKAKIETETAIQLAPRQNQISLDDLKKPTQEEQKWIDLIVENPKNISAYKALGLIYWKRCNYNDAKASFETAIKLGSKDKKIEQILVELKERGNAAGQK